MNALKVGLRFNSRRLISSSGSPPDSFIARASANGVASLIGAFPTSDRFDASLSGLEIVSIDTETKKVIGKFTVDVPVENSWRECLPTSTFRSTDAHTHGTDKLHGGATALLVDVFGTLALLTSDDTKPGVSLEMNQSYVGTIALCLSCLTRTRKQVFIGGFTR